MLASKQLILARVRTMGETTTVSQQAGTSAILGPAGNDAMPQDRRRLIFAIVSIALFMASIDHSFCACIFPTREYARARSGRMTIWR